MTNNIFLHIKKLMLGHPLVHHKWIKGDEKEIILRVSLFPNNRLLHYEYGYYLIKTCNYNANLFTLMLGYRGYKHLKFFEQLILKASSELADWQAYLWLPWGYVLKNAKNYNIDTLSDLRNDWFVLYDLINEHLQRNIQNFVLNPERKAIVFGRKSNHQKH